MLCHCSTNTLRLFIRSLAHVDVPTSAKLVPRRYLQGTSSRHPSLAFRSQQQFPRRELSSHTCLRDTLVSAVKEDIYEAQHDGVEVDAKGAVEATNQETSASPGAFVDFSLEAIDDILAESHSEELNAEVHTRRVALEDDSPAGFVVNTLAKQRERRERRDRDKELSDATMPKPSNKSSLLMSQRQERQEADTSQYATFPRLPRINRDQTRSTPLNSRLLDPLKPITNHNPKTDRISREHWQIDKNAIKAKYPSGYKPQKRLSPDAITGIRALHAQMPEEYHTRKLAETFQVSPEAISRILRTKWTPNAEEEADRARRWLKRGESVWTRYAEMGVKPPKRWREAGIGKDLPEEVFTKRREKRATKEGVVPMLVTLPKRQGGVYQLGGKRKKASGDNGASFI